MRVLGIYGSPRVQGNTDLLLDRALEGARSAGAEIDTLHARSLRFSGCLECGGCDATGHCVVRDDMQEVYPLLEQADSIVVAAPVFFYNVPAQLKALIDRSQAMWARRLLLKQGGSPLPRHKGGGYLIAVGATRGKQLFEGTELTVRYFFDALNMDYKGGLYLRKIEGKGEILSHPEALEQARALGAKAAAGLDA